MRDGETRFYGPHKHGDKWRLRRVDRRGTSSKSTWIPYDTEEQAHRAKKAAERKVATTGKLISDAMDAYLLHLKDDQGRAENTLAATRNFLAALFPDPAEALADIDADHYARLRKRPGRKPGSTTAPATHQRALRAGQAFCAWCIKQGWLQDNPLTGVETVGEAKKGKSQHRIDEGRAWLRTAFEMAPGCPGVLGALCCCLLGFRVSEVLSRQVRDLDDRGRVLWVRGKGAQSDTPISLLPPDGEDDSQELAQLRDLLQAAAKGKLPLAGLIDTTEFGITYWTRKVCERARVPQVCPHSLRGLHSTAALLAGQTPAAVCRTLRHGEAVDRQHYAAAGAQATGARNRVLRLVGGEE